MRLKQQWWSGLVAAVLGGLVSVTAGAAAEGEQFLALLGAREGPCGFNLSRRSMPLSPM